jgi:predicted nucleic acid-binding protein
MTLAVDSSVVVPALDTSHEAHERVATFLEQAGELRLITHVALETYHVLTRVRPHRRLPPSAVVEALRSTFPGPLVGLTAEDYWAVVALAPSLGIVGGAIFDALIGSAAHRAALGLVSRDRRAAATYAALGIDWELVPDV